ncbi:MAG TPA: hypothetical protein VGF44_10955 [Terriglobales bacterium]
MRTGVAVGKNHASLAVELSVATAVPVLDKATLGAKYAVWLLGSVG